MQENAIEDQHWSKTSRTTIFSGTVPPPFNIIPTPKSVFYSIRCNAYFFLIRINLNWLLFQTFQMGSCSTLWQLCPVEEGAREDGSHKKTTKIQNQIVSLHLPKFWKNKILVTLLLGCRRKCERSKNATRGIRRSWGTWFADMSLRWVQAEDMSLGCRLLATQLCIRHCWLSMGHSFLSITHNTCCCPFLGTTRFCIINHLNRNSARPKTRGSQKMTSTK